MDLFFVGFWVWQAKPLQSLKPGSVRAWLAVPKTQPDARITRCVIADRSPNNPFAPRMQNPAHYAVIIKSPIDPVEARPIG